MAIDAGNCFLSINAQDVSAKVMSITGLTQQREEVDITVMGASIREMQATLEQIQDFTVTFRVDAWNDTLYTTLATMWANPATAYAVAFRPTTAAISATNPEFQFNARLPQNNLFDQAQPGQVFKRTVNLRRVTAVTVDITP